MAQGEQITSDSLAEELERFQPLTPEEQKRFIGKVNGILAQSPKFAVKVVGKEQSIEFLKPSLPRAEKTVYIFDDELPERSHSVIIQIQGRHATVGRILMGKNGGVRFDHNLEEDTYPGMLRRGDIELVEEYIEHPDHFEEYDPKFEAAETE